nr:CAP domain-containing protein [uncultured Tyzzerella sp.]
MKKFIITTFALTLFSTANVFGASGYQDNSIYDFLTINGKPVKEYNFNNNQDKPEEKPQNKPNNKPQEKPNNKPNNKPEEKPQNKPNNKPQEKPNSKPDNSINNDNNLSSISPVEQEVVRLVNIERQKAGLAPLKIDTKLSNVARLKSEDMKKKGYFSHTSPTYGSPFDMLKQFNITYKTAGENIAKGQKTAQSVVDAWMNSEGHRRNILSKSFTHIGVGESSKHWTQLFISK